jgi:heat shock protein beta
VAWSDGYVYFLSNLWRDADGDGIQNEIDNCAGSYNPDQLNTDAAPIVSPGLPQATDITVPRGDLLGDVCDTDDDNDDIADIFEISGCGVSGPLSELNGDTDYDRVRDRAECDLGTNPADSRSRPSQTQPNDSDHDGLPDALEIALGSDPNNVRTLPRGILDSYLYKGYSLNPSIADNDGDGCPDNIEIASLDGDKILSSGDQGLLAYAIAHHLNLPNPDLTKDLTVNSGDQGQWAAIKASFGDSPARC